jgi:hypothetical protein
MSESARKIIEAFEVANIRLRVAEWNNAADAIYIGPRPML